MSKIHLQVKLPKHRDYDGNMTVFIDGTVAKMFVVMKPLSVKGRGSKRLGDTSFLINGNTPTGEYQGKVENSINRDKNIFGHNGLIRLEPLGGNALIATKIFGRSGLLIHGGRPSSDGHWKTLGGLRPTNGCLRLSDENIKILMNLIDKSKHDENKQISSETEITITIEE